MGAAVSVFDHRLHHVVVLGNEHVTGSHVDFALIDFSARLIEAFFDVVQIEDDIVSRGLADDADDLAFLDLESFPRVALDDRLADDFHCALHVCVIVCRKLADEFAQYQGGSDLFISICWRWRRMRPNYQRKRSTTPRLIHGT